MDSQSKFSVTSGVGEERSKLRSPRRKQYTPFATSPPFLISILCAILACIALIELVLHKGTKDVTSSAKVKARAVDIVPKQDGESVSLCTEYATQTAYTTTTIYGTASADAVRRALDNRRRQENAETTIFTTDGTVTTATYTVLFTLSVNAYGSISTSAATCQSTTTLFTTITAQVTAYGSLTTSTTSTTPTPVTSFLSATSAYGSLTTPISSAPTPVTSTAIAALYPSLTEPATIATSNYPSLTTTSPSDYPSLTTPSTSLYPSLTTSKAASSTGHLSLTRSITSATATTSNESGLLDSTSYPSIKISSSTMITRTSDLISSVPTPAGTPGASGLSNTPIETTTGTVEATTVYSTSFTIYTSSSISTVVAIPTSTSSSFASTSTTSAADSSFTQSDLRIGNNFSRLDYFNAMYFPILLAVILKSVWVVVFASTKMMEPFHQLSKPRGATAEDTLFADYLSTGLSLSSVKAVFQGHWVMALTTGVYVLFALLPSLAAEAMTVKFLAKCDTHSDIGTVRCDPAWMVDVSVIRGIEILLGTVAIMILVLVILQWKRKNDVMSDPSSIASMASLLHHPDVLADFQQIDPMANTDELSFLLTGNQFKLGTYESSPGQYRYGLIKTVGTVRTSESGAFPGTRYQSISNPNNNESKPIATPTPWGAIRDGALALGLLGLLGVCIGYYLDGKNDPFNNFFNSNTFGPRFLLVIVATVVDYQWKRIEREVRITEPFRHLSKRMASPRTTILTSRAGTPLSALLGALWNMNFFPAAIAAVALLADVLIIAISGVPFSSAEIKPASLASFYTSFGILGIMLISLLAVIIWRRQNPTMPHQPDTLASVWLYLCASNMLEDFEGMEFMTESVRDKSIRDAGRKYFYGMATGSDGKDRFMVDHEDSGGTVFY